MRSGKLIRSVHRLHRWFGSILAPLVAIWFASGAVMLFTGYPSYTEQERLAQAQPLAAPLAVSLPAALRRWFDEGGAATGARARLSMLEGQPTWTWTSARGQRMAVRAVDQRVVTPLGAARARALAEHAFGRSSLDASRLTQPDQWTLSGVPKPLFPLVHVTLADAAGTEVYVSIHSGEIVQASVSRERFWAWLGAIPHWIYPASLRRERELWRDTVLCLSGLTGLLTLSGSIAGLHVLSATRKRRAAGQAPRSRNTYLRWHQRIGLTFGALASTWVLSGALSLGPFQWSGAGPSDHALLALHGKGTMSPSASQLTAALSNCQRAFAVRELELTTFAGGVYATCLGDKTSLIIDLTRTAATATGQAPLSVLRAAARRLTADVFALSQHSEPDDYYYPSHGSTDFVTPYVRLDLSDPDATSYYLDPARLRVLEHTTRLKRLERWLYHGLHSWDFAALYAQPLLWRSFMVVAMALGLGLVILGAALPVSRAIRRRRH